MLIRFPPVVLSYSCHPYILSIDLLDRIRRSLWEEKQQAQLVGMLRTVDLLVIDDIGAEKATEWVQATLYSIIDHRYGRKDTVFTTNLTGFSAPGCTRLKPGHYTPVEGFSPYRISSPWFFNLGL